MADADDDAFFAALSGRARGDLPGPVRVQAEALRAAVLAIDASFDAPPERHRQQLERLLFRLRREKLLRAATPRWAWPLAAAAVVVAAVVLVLYSRGGPNAPEEGRPEMRGAPEAIQVIEVADVDAAERDVVAALLRVGVSAQGYSLGVRRGVNASVPPERRTAAAKELAPLGVTLPVSGELRLELREAQAPK